MDVNKSVDTKASAKIKKARQLQVTSEANFTSNLDELFRPIYESCFPYATTLAYTNKIRNCDDAQDIAQQTMLRVWKRIKSGREDVTNIKCLVAHSFRYEWADWLEKTNHGRQKARARATARTQPVKPKTEVTEVVEYTTYDYTSYRQPAPARGVGGEIYEFGATFVTEPLEMERLIDTDTLAEPESAFLANELSVELQEALASLPEKWRQALLGQVFENLSLADLCDKYGWTLDQTKKYLAYAKTKLRLLLTGELLVKPWHKQAQNQAQNQAKKAA